MKKFILILILPLMFSCGSKKEIEALKAKNDSLAALANLKDTTILSYVRGFNDIQANLDSIKIKENIISQNSAGKTELKQDAKDKISQDITSIYQLVQQNKQKIASLSKKLKKSNARVAELEKMVETLNKMIEQKDVEISQLNEALTKLNIKVEELSQNVNNLAQQNAQKEQTINQQTEALNTAYYVIGTKKELEQHKIVIKRKVLQPDFDRSYFTKIDIRNIKALPVFKKNALIVTSHPTSSYKFIKPKKIIDSLIITDYNSFWSSSKYLVVVID